MKNELKSGGNQAKFQITLLTIFPISRLKKRFLNDRTASNGFQFWRRRGSQNFHNILPYISLVLNSGGMQIAGARVILEKSSEKTYREKTDRGTKRIVH